LLQKKDGSFVRSKDQVRVGEALSVQVVDGRFGVRVENREGKDVRGQTGSS
jgi:exonuclease VII large subunit